MHARRALIFVTFASLSAGASAQGTTEIYKCTDPSGRPLYTSDKKDTAGRKCELVSREVNVVSPQRPPPSRAAPGARESSEVRSAAKQRQREILESELRNEEQLLAKAREELAEQENTRSGGERNYARVIERLQPFKDNVELHEKNVEALRRELGNLNR